jgi:hypothetical protein
VCDVRAIWMYFAWVYVCVYVCACLLMWMCVVPHTHTQRGKCMGSLHPLDHNTFRGCAY